jgi:hypothetical protein
VLVLALATDQDVGRLHVAVHQPALVRGIERRGNRVGDSLDAVHIELAPVDDLAQVGARHEAHRQVEDALEFPAPVNGDDVRMLQRGRQPGLGLEARDRLRVLGVLGRDDLQRHGPIQLRVRRLVDHAHPAPVEHSLDAVAREQRAGRESRQALGCLIHAPTPPVETVASQRKHPSSCAPRDGVGTPAHFHQR